MTRYNLLSSFLFANHDLINGQIWNSLYDTILYCSLIVISGGGNSTASLQVTEKHRAGQGSHKLIFLENCFSVLAVDFWLLFLLRINFLIFWCAIVLFALLIALYCNMTDDILRQNARLGLTWLKQSLSRIALLNFRISLNLFFIVYIYLNNCRCRICLAIRNRCSIQLTNSCWQGWFFTASILDENFSSQSYDILAVSCGTIQVWVF